VNEISKDQLAEIVQDYIKFKELNNSDLKASYLATSGRGYVEIIKSTDDSLALYRPSDDTFVCMSRINKAVPRVEVDREDQTKFHTDLSIFEKKGG
jgi:hypothetical protein